MESIEATGATIQEAIAAGMEQLGVDSPSQVMVEVLQEPDAGIMGHGARGAIVRLLFMGTRGGTEIAPTSIVSGPVPQGTTQIVAEPYEYNYDDDNNEDDEEAEAAAISSDSTTVAYDDAPQDTQVAYQILNDLLKHMEMTSNVTIRRANSTRSGEHTHWILNVTGKHVSRLIGHRGETLDSLQYITRLIVSRRLQRRANIIVDAGNYKSRRSDNLKRLANRMADQAVNQRKTVTLEPMPPHERRIIHLTLRQRKDVSTKSVGEGRTRKVTIRPN